MSHVTEICGDSPDQQITDIAAIRSAVEACGLMFKEGQTTFRTWASDHDGRFVGDYPTPDGWNADEIGMCLHAAGLKDEDKRAGYSTDEYEIGIVQSRKFPGTMSLMLDFFGGAMYGKCGDKCGKLMQHYRANAVANAHRAMGDGVNMIQQDDGSIVVEADTTVRMGQ